MLSRRLIFSNFAHSSLVKAPRVPRAASTTFYMHSRNLAGSRFTNGTSSYAFGHEKVRKIIMDYSRNDLKNLLRKLPTDQRLLLLQEYKKTEGQEKSHYRDKLKELVPYIFDVNNITAEIGDSLSRQLVLGEQVHRFPGITSYQETVDGDAMKAAIEDLKQHRLPPDDDVTYNKLCLQFSIPENEEATITLYFTLCDQEIDSVEKLPGDINSILNDEPAKLIKTPKLATLYSINPYSDIPISIASACIKIAKEHLNKLYPGIEIVTCSPCRGFLSFLQGKDGKFLILTDEEIRGIRQIASSKNMYIQDVKIGDILHFMLTNPDTLSQEDKEFLGPIIEEVSLWYLSSTCNEDEVFDFYHNINSAIVGNVRCTFNGKDAVAVNYVLNKTNCEQTANDEVRLSKEMNFRRGRRICEFRSDAFTLEPQISRKTVPVTNHPFANDRRSIATGRYLSFK